MESRKADPFYQDVPWEIIYDDAGCVIGEVYLLDMPERLFKKKRRKKLEPSY